MAFSSETRTYFPQPAVGYTQPFWRTQLDPLDNHRSTRDLPRETDILIIGGGYAGASAAYHLFAEKQQDTPPKVVLLEARELCSGATGRNGLHPILLTNTYAETDVRAGGHLRPDLYSATATYTERYGIDAAVEVVRFEIAHMKILEELVRKEKIDCDLTFSRSYDIYLNVDQLADAKRFYDFLVEQGLDFMEDVKYLSQEDAQGVSRSVPQSITFASTDSTLEKTAKVRNAQGGFSFSAGHLWPYKLIAGLIRIAVSRGLNLQTKTMVTEIGKTRTPEGLWPVKTDRGVIYARKIVLATNAFTSALAPEYSKAIVPCKGLCTQIQTAPGAPYQKLPETYAIRHGPGAFIYQISRNDESIIVGGAQYTYRDEPGQWHNNTDDGTLIKNVEHYFDGYMQRTFFGWEDSQATVKHIWTGGKQRTSPLHSPH